MSDLLAETSDEVSETLSELPPACRLVYLAIAMADEPLLRETIDKRTASPGRTTRRALRTLEEQDLIEREPCFGRGEPFVWQTSDDLGHSGHAR